MFLKNLSVEYLLDFYGDVLSEREKGILSAYYGEDLSLAEIASLVGISRQGVRHILKKGEEQLLFLEERLGLAARHRAIEPYAAELKAIADAIEAPSEAREAIAARVRSIADALIGVAP